MTETYQSEQPRGDEVFANSSNETVVENIDYSLVLEEAGAFLNTQSTVDACKNYFPISRTVKDETSEVEVVTHNSSVNRSLFPDYDGQVDVSFTVNQLIVHSSNLPRRLFCPFCTQHYGFEFLLKEHIKKNHTLEIETFVINSKNYQFHSCPFCQARFYLTDLLMKHVMYRHQECVLSILREASPHQYIDCKFCPFRVWKKDEKQMLIHVENKHLKSFETAFTERYSNILESENDADKSTCDTVKTYFDSPNLSIPPNILPVSSTFEHQQLNNGVHKSILKNRQTCEDECQMKNPSDAPYFTARSGAVKRRLHYEEEKRDNSDTCTKKVVSIDQTHRRSRWKALFKKMRRHRSIPKQPFLTSTPYANSGSNQRNCLTDYASEAHCAYSSTISPAKRVKFSLMQTEIETDEVLDEEHGILSNTYTKIQPVVNRSIETEPVLKQFKCALCLQAFFCNNELLNHTRRKHSGPFNLLRPRYRCGECEAKFYKNSYLLRHCKFHHTPLCLRNRKHS